MQRKNTSYISFILQCGYQFPVGLQAAQLTAFVAFFNNLAISLILDVKNCKIVTKQLEICVLGVLEYNSTKDFKLTGIFFYYSPSKDFCHNLTIKCVFYRSDTLLPNAYLHSGKSLIICEERQHFEHRQFVQMNAAKVTQQRVF